MQKAVSQSGYNRLLRENAALRKTVDGYRRSKLGEIAAENIYLMEQLRKKDQQLNDLQKSAQESYDQMADANMQIIYKMQEVRKLADRERKAKEATLRDFREYVAAEKARAEARRNAVIGIAQILLSVGLIVSFLVTCFARAGGQAAKYSSIGFIACGLLLVVTIIFGASKKGEDEKC